MAGAGQGGLTSHIISNIKCRRWVPISREQESPIDCRINSYSDLVGLAPISGLERLRREHAALPVVDPDRLKLMSKFLSNTA
jgi:hypothetical protein